MLSLPDRPLGREEQAGIHLWWAIVAVLGWPGWVPAGVKLPGHRTAVGWSAVAHVGGAGGGAGVEVLRGPWV